jgi:hypothetical protein
MEKHYTISHLQPFSVCKQWNKACVTAPSCPSRLTPAAKITSPLLFLLRFRDNQFLLLDL